MDSKDVDKYAPTPKDIAEKSGLQLVPASAEAIKVLAAVVNARRL